MRFAARHLVLLITLTLPAGARAQGDPVIPGELKNIQVLKGMTKPEIGKFMKSVAKAMGKQCKFCHEKDYSLDTKDTKKAAREMMTMLREMNEKYLRKYTKHGGTCFMCHRGSPEPALEP